MTYTFKQFDDFRRLGRHGKLMLPESDHAQAAHGAYGAYAAAFQGALLRLFGEPMINGSDARYEYLIEAGAADGRTYLLSAYHGASGPAIGGDSTDASLYPVAIALRDLIEATSPRDFEVTEYFDEYDTTVTLGCANGACYWYEARGHTGRVTKQQHEQREHEELLEHTARIERWVADGTCYVCDGEGYVGPSRGSDTLCPECHGSGKLAN